MARTGGTAVVDQLLAEETSVVFGLPGAQLDHAVDALARRSDRIRFLHTRHEQGAGYMADGYARTSGRIGVVMVVPGPGLLNASAALATAWACSSPVVALIGSTPTWADGRRAGVLHELADQSGILRHLLGWHRRVTSADDIPDAIADAFGAAGSGRSRPVAVEIPADLLSAETTAPPVTSRTVHRPPPDAEAIAAAADLLDAAVFPVIVAGNGVTMSDAGIDLVRLAERIGAPVVLTTNGKAAAPHDHPMVVGQAVGREIIPRADVVLAVGTRLVNAVGRPVPLPSAARLVVVNVDEADLGGWRAPTVGVRADARLGLRALAASVRNRDHDRDPLPAIEIASAIHRDQVAACGPLVAHVEAIRSAVPRDGIVVADLTQAGYLANAIFPVYEPRSYLTSGWQGTLGYSFPTALGAKVAHPDRAVVAVIGDGGLGFTMNEMATAARHGIATTVVCFRDDAYGNVRRTQLDAFGGRTVGTDLHNPDFVEVARAHGLEACRAVSPDQLEVALSESIAADRPALIEVPIGDVPSPWHLFTDRAATAG